MLKLFCNCCQKFIRDAHMKEVGKLTGLEICTDCEGTIAQTFKEVEKISKRGQHQMVKIEGRIKADLETALRKVLKKE